MQQYKLKAWLGETIPLQVEWDTDITADATIIIYGEEGIAFQKTAPFVDNVATLDISPVENTALGVGLFKYLIKVTYPEGDIDIIPDGVDVGGCTSCTDHNCIAPDFEICGVPA